MLRHIFVEFFLFVFTLVVTSRASKHGSASVSEQLLRNTTEPSGKRGEMSDCVVPFLESMNGFKQLTETSNTRKLSVNRFPDLFFFFLLPVQGNVVVTLLSEAIVHTRRVNMVNRKLLKIVEGSLKSRFVRSEKLLDARIRNDIQALQEQSRMTTPCAIGRESDRSTSTVLLVAALQSHRICSRYARSFSSAEKRPALMTENTSESCSFPQR